MGIIITTVAARAHLGVGDETDDGQLEDLNDAAEASLADFLGRPLIGEDGWDSPSSVPANVVHAAKLVLTDLFEQRCTPLQDMTSVRNLCGRHIRQSFA